jgi:hypothetical protein
MASETDLVPLLIASMSDEAKGRRMAEIQAEQLKLEDMKAELERIAAHNQAVVAEAAEHRSAGDSAFQKAEAKAAELDQREAEMGRVLAAMNEEKAAFEAIRDTVEKEQSARRLDLETTAADLSKREKAIATRENDVAAEQVFARRMSLLATWKIDRLREAIAEIPPEQ